MYQGFKTINDAIQETLDYIEARRNGSIKSIKSKWNKLNKVFLNGYEWGTINIIAGLSSSGKTLLIDQLEQSFIDLNKDQEFIVINFNFEMTAKNLILRKLSSKKKLTLKQLLSADEDYKLSEGELNDIRAELSLMVSDNIFYFEKPQTNNEMFKTIEKMWNQYHKPMIVFLDHSILIKKSASESSYLDMLYNSAEMFNSLKKQFPIIIFIVSQLNREIEAVERKQRPSTLNYPIKADIWGSDALFQIGDSVMVNHRPFQLGIKKYGDLAIPVSEDDLFWHILKNRNGTIPILRMTANFKNMEINEYEK